MSLFGVGGAAAGAGAAVQFRAGKMERTGTKVKADPRKGLVVVKKEDGLMHFQWKERTATQPEDDLILFPGDATFEKVSQSKDRVYVLKFQHSSRRLFFWMQEPKADGDDERCKKVDDALNNPDAGEDAAPAGGGLGGLSGIDAAELSQQLGMGQEQFMQLLQSGVLDGALGQQQQQQQQAPAAAAPAAAAPAAATPAAPAAAAPAAAAPAPAASSAAAPASSEPVLQPASSSVITPEALASALASAGGVARPSGVKLSDVIDADRVGAILRTPDMQAELKQLIDLLPDGTSVEEVADLIRSPQFRQFLGQFDHALNGSQLGDLMASFGLDPSLAGPLGGSEGFLHAVQKQVDKEKEEKQ